MWHNASATLVLLCAIGLSADIAAQYPGGQGGGPGGARGGMGGGRGPPPQEAPRGGPSAEIPLSPGAMVQVQLDQLEDDLRLTPAQIGAWRTYADRVQKLADDTSRSRMDARAATTAGTMATAVAQLDQIAGATRARTRIIDEIAESGRELYGLLTEGQRAIADRRLTLAVTLLATGVAPPGMTDGGGRGARRPPL